MLQCKCDAAPKKTLPFTTGFRLNKEVLLPIRPAAVVRVQIACPTRIGHRRPMLLVEAGCVSQPLLVDVEYEAMVVGIHRECMPRNGEVLLADAEKSADRHYRIRDAPRTHVEHDLLDLADVFTLCIDDRFAFERARGHDLGTRSAVVV